MQIFVISCSLNPKSRSRVLAQEAVRSLGVQGVEVEFADLRELKLPFCDGEASYDAPGVEELSERIRAASGLILAVPVYNYDVNAAAKNLIELTGDAWNGKPVGFLCAAGGRSSYMSVLGLANSLMLDFRCWIVPRFVYATRPDVTDGAITSENIVDRVHELTAALVQLARGMEAVQDESSAR
jgi:NAD(P)H-dependent FMN reductase